VVDADYAVDPQWLRRLVAHFSDPGVAVVQAPQAHRDFASSPFRRMANWEFDGFFRIGMHHRNERNAIIQHGTMTLVRRQALDRGRRLGRMVHLRGRGARSPPHGGRARGALRPTRCSAAASHPPTSRRSRRSVFRWAFGAMQILKAHARALFGGAR